MVPVKTTRIGPPLWFSQPVGRSYRTVSTSTAGPPFHFARNRVPTPTGPSVSFSTDWTVGFHSRSLRRSLR